MSQISSIISPKTTPAGRRILIWPTTGGFAALSLPFRIEAQRNALGETTVDVRRIELGSFPHAFRDDHLSAHDLHLIWNEFTLQRDRLFTEEHVEESYEILNQAEPLSEEQFTEVVNRFSDQLESPALQR